MKKSIVSYINTMSKTTPDILEMIIKNKYRKFISFYWMVHSYSNKFSDMEYEPSDDNELKITIHFKTESDSKEVYSELISSDNKPSSIVRKNKKITIVLEKDESTH